MLFRQSLYCAMVLSLVACSDKKDESESSGSGSGSVDQTSLKGLVETGINAIKRNDSAAMKKLILSSMDLGELAKEVKACDAPEVSIDEIKSMLKPDLERISGRANAKFEQCAALVGDWSTAKEIRREGGSWRSRERDQDDSRSKCGVKEYSDFEVLFEVGDRHILVEFDDPRQLNGRFYIEKIRCDERRVRGTAKTGYGGAIKTGYRRYDRAASKTGSSRRYGVSATKRPARRKTD